MTADASGPAPVREAEEDHPRSSNRDDDASASDLPTEPASAAPSAGAPAMPDFARHLHPVAERVKGATEKLAATFNEQIVPSTTRGLDDAKHGWRTRVAPSLESGASSVASFFGKVSEKVRESNDVFQKRSGEMGEEVSRRTKTAMDTIKEGTRELRFGVADLMTRDPMTFAAAEKADDDQTRNQTRQNAVDGDAVDDVTISAKRDPKSSLDRSLESTSDPMCDSPAFQALLGVRLEQRAAWDFEIAPAPLIVIATCQWLCANKTFLESQNALISNVREGTEEDEHTAGDEGYTDDINRRDALLASFAKNPVYIIGPEVKACVVLDALFKYLESLPEPLVAFSLYAALAREGASVINAEDDAPDALPKSDDKVEALFGLLSPARRVALECVLQLAARFVAARGEEETESTIAAAAAAVAPRVAWPRAGRWSKETTRRALEGQTVLDPSSNSDRAAREARAVAKCVAQLIKRRVAEIREAREKNT